jgi:hypothetical protein
VTFVVEESSISELCVGETCVISGFRRNVNEICALLGCYTTLVRTVSGASEQSIGAIFKSQAVEEIECVILDDGTHRSRDRR